MTSSSLGLTLSSPHSLSALRQLLSLFTIEWGHDQAVRSACLHDPATTRNYFDILQDDEDVNDSKPS